MEMSEPIIGYKKLKNGYIAKLEILGINTQNRPSVKEENQQYAKYRCSIAKVLDIYKDEEKTNMGVSTYNDKFVYTVGEIIKPDAFDVKKKNVCSSGIHYFLDEKVANDYNPRLQRYTADKKSNKNGEVRLYYENGELKHVYTLVNGRYDGQYISYDKKGNMIGYAEYKNGQLNGNYKVWYNNRIRDDHNYKNDKLDGEYKCYDYNGNILRNDFYKNGKKHGLCKTYHDGVLTYETSYYDGKAHGPTKCYILGKLNFIENYKYGCLDGESTYWNEDGNISSIINFINGSLRESKSWYKNGNPHRVSSYNEEYQHTGENLYWHENGQMHMRSTYDDNGELNGPSEVWDTNGYYISRNNYVNGKLDGEQTTYRNGSVYITEHYMNNKRHGSFIQRYKNGNIKIQKNYISGKLHGTYIRYLKDGSIENITEYRNGRSIGKTAVRNEDLPYPYSDLSDNTLLQVGYVRPMKFIPFTKKHQKKLRKKTSK